MALEGYGYTNRDLIFAAVNCTILMPWQPCERFSGNWVKVTTKLDGLGLLIPVRPTHNQRTNKQTPALVLAFVLPFFRLDQLIMFAGMVTLLRCQGVCHSPQTGALT